MSVRKNRNSRDKTTFKVRCAREFSFYMLVEARDQVEAEYMARGKMDNEDDEEWVYEATHARNSYEVEEGD